MRGSPTLIAVALALTSGATAGCTFNPQVPPLGGEDAAATSDAADIGPGPDGGRAPDASPRDAGAPPRDAGPPDASPKDAEPVVDSGSSDAGFEDAMVEPDVGFPDSGMPCGDGTVMPPEACDDGRNDDGDGCNAACEVEEGWRCEGSPSQCTELPVLEIQDTLTDEGDPARFTVTLSAPAPFDVTFTWSTSDDTAVAGDDYTPVSQEALLIAQGGQTVDLVVNTLSDVDLEGDEHFTVEISQLDGAQPGNLTARATIEDVPVIVNRGLLVRYYLDDAAPGSSLPSTMQDSAPDPLPLSVITDRGDPDPVEESTGRGLSWDEEGRDGRLGAWVDGTKVRSRVRDSKQGTIECVARIVRTANASRFVHIGSGSELGRFSGLMAADLHLSINNQLYTWPFPMSARNRRALFTMVFDSEAAAPQARQRLYIDGVDQGPAQDSVPEDTEISLPFTSSYLVVGNRTGGDSSMEGELFYCAVYTEALDATEVARNAAVLLNHDDP